VFAFPSCSRGAISTVSALKAGERKACPDPYSQAKDEQPDCGPSGEQRNGQAGLRRTAEHVGHEHDPAPSQPVRDRAGEREKQHLRDHRGREHVPEAGRAAPAVRTAQAIATVDIDEPGSEVTYPV
jgi:hypothetical protein